MIKHFIQFGDREQCALVGIPRNLSYSFTMRSTDDYYWTNELHGVLTSKAANGLRWTSAEEHRTTFSLTLTYN